MTPEPEQRHRTYESIGIESTAADSEWSVDEVGPKARLFEDEQTQSGIDTAAGRETLRDKAIGAGLFAAEWVRYKIDQLLG